MEHRIFREISKNWAGHPLESFDIMLNFINDTDTDTGLHIKAYVDDREYAKGIKISDKEFKSLNISKSKELGNWNYTINPLTSAIGTARGARGCVGLSKCELISD